MAGFPRMADAGLLCRLRLATRRKARLASGETVVRATLLAIGILLVATCAFAADPIEGEWLTPTGGSKVRIGPCPNKPDLMCGVVSWLPADKAKDLDSHNPNAALRNRPILGVTTVSNFKQAAPGRWTGGKLYDPSTGKTYNGKISANPDGTLKVEGCVLMVCQAQTWKRG
jgi:uncharacterized protein (DUF2147 family)